MPKFKTPPLSASDIHKLHVKPDVQRDDRVRTRTGRLGVVRNITGQDTAHVDWDDGDSFPIKTVHLEVLARNWTIGGNGH